MKYKLGERNTNQRDWVVVILIWALALASGLWAYTYYLNWQQQNGVIQAVKSVCDYSREIVSGSAEQACGMVQDATNSEYLCDSYRSDARCWVEVK